MKKHIKILLLSISFCFLIAFLIILANSEQKLVHSVELYKNTVKDAVIDNTVLQVSSADQKDALVLYHAADLSCEGYMDNLVLILDILNISPTCADISHVDPDTFCDYDLVIVSYGKWGTEMDPSLLPLIEYVEQGGRLFIGTLVENISDNYSHMAELMGIQSHNGYANYSTLYFERELIPGITGMTFSSENFFDSCIDVRLNSSCDVYLSTGDSQNSIPLAWTNPWKDGQVSVFNGTSIREDFWRGVLCGCINSLFDTHLYPVINASCLFIDDFPSPQYESESDVTMEQYNRSVKEFYRDIWWPNMQIAARRYDDVYTGLFIATYNDIVDPAAFFYEQPSMEQYYGNSLLSSGHEMGAHGYNHQSLTLAGGTPTELNYQPWASQQDMYESLVELNNIKNDLFPYVSFKTYVPPSNFLSEEGRRALKEAFPELKVISGILSSDEGYAVCTQHFGTGTDGIVDFPRITSGMIFKDYDLFAAMNGIGAYGVFSHFIHPDDLFDPLRSEGYTWEQMYDAYCSGRDILTGVHPYLRPLATSEAADAVTVWENMTPLINIDEDHITGSIDNFCGEAFFYLKTDKTPQIVDDSCHFVKIGATSSDCYYFVTVNQANFKIKLVDK